MAFDPSDIRNAAQAGHSLAEHHEVLMRVGGVSFIAGIAGGTVAFLRTSRTYQIPCRLIFYCYLAKVGLGCLASYLALLVLPIFGLGTSTEAEQLIAVLSAMMGADFIGLLMRRILGDQRQNNAPWHGEDRRGSGNGNPPTPPQG